MKKNKVIILSYFLPGYKVGGPLVSILSLVKRLSDVYDFKVITPDRDFGDETPYQSIQTNRWVDSEYAKVYYVKKDFFTIFNILNQLKNNIDREAVVYLNSVFNFYYSILIVVAKRLNIMSIDNVVLAPRGELFDEALGFGSTKKRFFLWLAKNTSLYKNVIWHATTETEKQFIIKNLGIDPELIRVALIIPKLSKRNPPIYPEINHTDDNHQTLKIVWMARISKDKNIEFAFNVLSKVSVPVEFNIYGLIEDEDIWNQCLKMSESLPECVAIKYHGVLEHGDVVNKLEENDLFILPTFAENFGHSIAESLSVGTPVLISDNTPWRNLETRGLGWDINLSEPYKFINAIERMSKYSKAEKNSMRKQRVLVANLIFNDPQIITDNINLFKLPFHE